jgi:hypothetical protein
MNDQRQTVQLEPATTFVVYDRQSGEVVMVHHFSAMPGVPLPEAPELEAIALHHATDGDARNPDGLAAIQVQPGAVEAETEYRVSLPERTLVPLRSAGTQ